MVRRSRVAEGSDDGPETDAEPSGRSLDLNLRKAFIDQPLPNEPFTRLGRSSEAAGGSRKVPPHTHNSMRTEKRNKSGLTVAVYGVLVRCAMCGQ